MDDFNSYTTAVETNRSAVTEFLKTLNLNALKDITYWNGSKIDVSLNILGNKIYDILACTYIGALPKSESSGADGVLWKSAISFPEEIETKMSGVHRHEIALGAENSIYYSTNLDNPISKSALESKLAGAFHASMSESTLQTKARPTYLVIMDLTTNEWVGAWMLDSQTTIEQLEKRTAKKNKTLTLKLQVFLTHGQLVETNMPSIGLASWKAILVAHAIKNNRYIKSVRRENRIKKQEEERIKREAHLAWARTQRWHYAYIDPNTIVDNSTSIS